MLAALVVVSLLASPGLHDGLDPVVLYSMNGGSGTLEVNNSPEATILKRLLDSICD